MISGIIRFEPSILAVDPGGRSELPVRAAGPVAHGRRRRETRTRAGDDAGRFR